MLPTVSIVVQPPEASDGPTRAMDEACTASVRGGATCRTVGSDASRSDDDVAIARVVWLDEARLSAIVDVRTRSGVQRERRMSFGRADPPLERYRAVGFAVATLVDEVREAAAPPPTSSAEPTPPPPVPAATAAPSEARPVPSAPEAEEAPPPPPTSRPLFVGAGLAAVTGLDGALLAAVDGHLGAGIDPSVDLVISGGTSFSGEGSADRVRGRLTWIAAGGRPVVWANTRWRAYTRVEVFVEQLSLTAARGALRDAASKWQPGARIALDVEVPLVDVVGVGASAEVGVRSGPTTVFVGDVEEARLPVLRAGLSLGAVARF